MANFGGYACVEYTDTFGGEANYAWVRSYSFSIGDRSPKAIVRKAKALIGINGVKCRTTDMGDMIEIKPLGHNTIAFITFQNEIPDNLN